MNKILLFDTSSGSLNMGDSIINEAVQRELQVILRDGFVAKFPTHTPVTHWYQNFRANGLIKFTDSCDYKFIAGTNIITFNNLRLWPNWNVNIFNTRPYAGSILMGCGSIPNAKKINLYSKILYERILSNTYVHSTRDERILCPKAKNEQENCGGPMNNVQLKKVQKQVLNIYKEIKNICDEYDIRYFAIGGTAIGAIRHNGFIPWDDDIDIAMPRKDYIRFKSLTSQLPEHLRFVDYSENSDSPIIFSKVQDINTCYTDSKDTNNPNTFYGIFVDIMPMDGVPENTILYKIFRLRLRILLLLQTMVVQYEYNIKTPTDTLAKKTLRQMSGILSSARVLNKTRLKKRFLKLMQRYPLEASTYTACLWQFVTSAGVSATERYPYQDFKEYVDMPFEDTTMRMPVGYEGYFAAVCPGFMTPPPKEKQRPHHHGIVDFNKSYLEYADEASKKRMGKHA